MDQGKITRFSLVCMYGKAAYTQAAMARRMEHRNPCIACMSLPAGDCGSQITDHRCPRQIRKRNGTTPSFLISSSSPNQMNSV
jgi:hypothetical protein